MTAERKRLLMALEASSLVAREGTCVVCGRGGGMGWDGGGGVSEGKGWKGRDGRGEGKGREGKGCT